MARRAGTINRPRDEAIADDADLPRAVAVTGRPIRTRRVGRWLMPLLAILVIAAVTGFLYLRNVADSGDRPGIDVDDDPSALAI